MVPRFLPCHQLRLLCFLLLSIQLRQRSSAEVALGDLPLVVLCSQSTAPTSRITAASFGKIPTTFVLLFNFLFTLSSGLFDHNFCQCSAGKVA